MNIRKVVVKIAYALIAALVIVLVGILIYQQRIIGQMASNETPVPTTTDVYAEAAAAGDINTPSGPPAQTLSGSDDLKYQLEATEEELEMAREDLAQELDKQADKTSDLIAMQKKMLANPTTRKMMRTNMESALDTTYGALFEALGLSDETLKEFKGLIADHQMQALETTFEMMDQSLSDEERKDAATMLEDQNTEFENQLKDLLGSSDYEQYEAYRERLSERQVTTAFTDSLGTDGELTGQQEQELIEAMYQARKELEAEYGDESEIESITNPVAAMDKQLERMDRLFGSYTESARSILSESQAQQFEAKMEEQLEMIKMSMEMARSLYGGSAPAE